MSDFQGLRVLVVDDSRHLRLLVRQILTAVGAKVAECATGREALLQYRACQPDVVLVDFEMPDMCGADLTISLRAAEANFGTRAAILLVTGHGDTRRVTAALRAGVDGVIAKPISPKLLLKHIAGAQARARVVAATMTQDDVRARSATG